MKIIPDVTKTKEKGKEPFDLIRQFQDASGVADPDEIMQEELEAQKVVRSQKINKCP